MRKTTLAVLVPLFLSGWPVFRFLGWGGLVGYWALGSLACVLALRWLRVHPPEAWLSVRNARVAVIGALLLYAVAFLILYPIADSGRVGGGSDRDNALDQATSRLLAGEYPYLEPTYLGRHISPLPGALLLSIPWVWVLGNASYQNFFWLVVLYLLLVRISRSEPRAALSFVLLTAGSASIQHELMVGGDLLANSIAVTLVAVVAGWGNAWSRGWRVAVLAVLAGLVFAWRANFLLVLPLVAARMARRTGRREATLFSLVSLVVGAAVILPFWIWDPEHFSPLRTYREIGFLDAVVPFFGALVVGGMVAAGLLLAAMRNSARWLRDASLVQMIPILAGGILVGVLSSWRSLSFLQFGLSPLFLWVADLMWAGGQREGAPS